MQILKNIEAKWFMDVPKDSSEYKKCWKTVFSILSEELGKNPVLQKHHHLHHMIRINKRKITSPLFQDDPHDVRICGDETIFCIIVDIARKAIIRRLQGNYVDYVPFSFPPYTTIEIPLSPEEEYMVLSNESLAFWCRNKSNHDEWSPCDVRVKSIGVELCDSGIVSIFLATEFPIVKTASSPLKAPTGSKAGSTDCFLFEHDDR